MLAPMIDMINHYPNDQCTTDIVHLGLEMETSSQKRLEVGYRRLRKKRDLSYVLPPEARFGISKKKSMLLFFYESFTEERDRDYFDHRELSDEEELRRALQVAEELVVMNRTI